MKLHTSTHTPDPTSTSPRLCPNLDPAPYLYLYSFLWMGNGGTVSWALGFGVPQGVPQAFPTIPSLVGWGTAALLAWLIQLSESVPRALGAWLPGASGGLWGQEASTRSFNSLVGWKGCRGGRGRAALARFCRRRRMPRADSSSRNPPVSLEVSLLGRPLALPDLLHQLWPISLQPPEQIGLGGASRLSGGDNITSFLAVLIGAVLGQGEAGQGHQHQRGLGGPPGGPG